MYNKYMINYNNKKYLTIEETAAKLFCSKQNIYNMIKIGKFREILQIGTTRKYIDEQEVDNMLVTPKAIESKKSNLVKKNSIEDFF